MLLNDSGNPRRERPFSPIIESGMDKSPADFRREAECMRRLAQETADTEMVSLLIRLADAYEEAAVPGGSDREKSRPSLLASKRFCS
jgi:hypothetical protein